MEKNLLGYFSLLVVSFSITTCVSFNTSERAYCAESKSYDLLKDEIVNQTFNTKDIYNFRIKTGEPLVITSKDHNEFKADVINNQYKVQIQFDTKEGVDISNYIVVGTDNSIVGSISNERPYVLDVNLKKGENPIRIINKLTNDEMYKFNINYKDIKVTGLQNVKKVGDSSKIEAVLDEKIYNHVIWSTSENNSIVVNSNGEVTAVQSGIACVNGAIYDESDKNIIGSITVDFYISGDVMTGWIKNGEVWYYLDGNTNELKRGWLEEKGDWYYFNEDGSLYRGWTQQDGVWYYLKQTGNMAVGWFKDDGNWYYSDLNGAMRTGWFKDHGNWYYLNENGQMQTSDLNIDGILFRFNKNGELQLD